MNIVGILLCRDEADILDATLTHMRQQGVGAILAIDNGSTDGTVDILDGHDCVVWHDDELAYNQEERMTRLANEPQALASDFILPFDADEFWMGTNGRTVSEIMETTTADILTARAYRIWPGNMRDPELGRLSSVAFRPWGGARLAKGNHSVARPGTVCADELLIHEYQYRSFEQMARKVRHGRRAVDAAGWQPDEGAHWRRYGLMSDQELHEEWVRLSNAPDLVAW